MAHQGLIRDSPESALVRDWQAPFPVDVRLTLSVHGRGGGDPTFRIDQAGAVWRTSLTPDGPGTIRVLASAPPPAASRAAGEKAAANADTKSDRPPQADARAHPPRSADPKPDPPPQADARAHPPRSADPKPDPPPTSTPDSAPASTRVRACAWGPGASWLLDALPAALGFHDDASGFDPSAHPVLREIAGRHPGLRVGRSGRLLEALVPAVLEQKVTGAEAHRAWRTLLGRFGTPPPGPAPAGMRVFPDARTWRRIPTWEWHRAGVEGIRAQTIFHAASVAESLERLLTLTNAEADRRLRSIPGIGAWTSAETMQRAAGDPDAVSVGDYNLPKAVGWALAGRQTTDDAAMLALLAPYAGHRHRVTRLVELSGLRPPRRGPRMSVRDYRSF